jgi:hypothetical protein
VHEVKPVLKGSGVTVTYFIVVSKEKLYSGRNADFTLMKHSNSKS